jgi:hypothetical protein
VNSFELEPIFDIYLSKYGEQIVPLRHIFSYFDYENYSIMFLDDHTHVHDSITPNGVITFESGRGAESYITCNLLNLTDEPSLVRTIISRSERKGGGSQEVTLRIHPPHVTELTSIDYENYYKQGPFINDYGKPVHEDYWDYVEDVDVNRDIEDYWITFHVYRLIEN